MQKSPLFEPSTDGVQRYVGDILAAPLSVVAHQVPLLDRAPIQEEYRRLVREVTAILRFFAVNPELPVDTRVAATSSPWGLILLEELLAICSAFHLPIVPVQEFLRGQSADYNPNTGVIRLREDDSIDRKSFFLTHELAHYFLHTLDWPATTNEAEVEAESVAYLVLKRLDWDTGARSFQYIACYGRAVSGALEAGRARIEDASAVMLALLRKLVLCQGPVGIGPPEPEFQQP